MCLAPRLIAKDGARRRIAGRVRQSVRWERPHERIGPQRVPDSGVQSDSAASVSTVSTGVCVRSQRVGYPLIRPIDGRGTGLYTSLLFVRRCRGRICVDPLCDLARARWYGDECLTAAMVGR